MYNVEYASVISKCVYKEIPTIINACALYAVAKYN